MVDTIRIYKVRDVKTPTRGTQVAAGLDFFVPNDLTPTEMSEMAVKTGHELEYSVDPATGFVSEMRLEWGQSACIPSGIKVRCPDGYCMEFHDKSGIAMKKGLIAGAKLCDQDYQGVYHIDVHNVSRNTAVIKAGDKIAQFVMYKVEYPVVETVGSVEELFAGTESERGSGAFGSTGTN